jgi:hypothetical protein
MKTQEPVWKKYVKKNVSDKPKRKYTKRKPVAAKVAELNIDLNDPIIRIEICNKIDSLKTSLIKIYENTGTLTELDIVYMSNLLIRSINK